MTRGLHHATSYALTLLLLASACQPAVPGGRRQAAQPPAASTETARPSLTTIPTREPTPQPTATLEPTPEPTLEPTAAPTAAPDPSRRAFPPPSGVVQRAGLSDSSGSCPQGIPPGLPPAANAPALIAGQAGVLRPVIVQIDNAAPARPPLHLTEAAAVYEYVAEGGVTRFSALFNKEDVGIVGPVRSARLISLELARQFEALLVYHGASSGVQERIWNGGIYFVSFNAQDSYTIHTRLADRPVPHNSISTLPQVRQYGVNHGVAPRVAWWPDFPRGDPPALETGTAITQLAVGFSGPDGAPWPLYRAEFRYVPEEHRYLRAIGGAPHVDGATGQQMAPETVVVQVAPVVVTNIVEDILGSLSLDYKLEGEGTAYFLREGRRWQGCWRRPGPFEPTTFYGPDGQPFQFGAGPVWIAEASPITPLTWG